VPRNKEQAVTTFCKCWLVEAERIGVEYWAAGVPGSIIASSE